MACGSLLSCHGENPDHKSKQEVDPDKPRFITSCLGDVTDPTFSGFFSNFGPPSPTFATDPRALELGYRVGSSGTPR